MSAALCPRPRAVAVLAALALAGVAAAPGPPRVSPAAARAPAAPPVASRAIAVTLDDLPGVGADTGLDRLRVINRKILAALSRARVPAIGFVNEGRLQVDGERDDLTALLRDWLEAGMDLGNHTFAHRGLTRTPLSEYEDDVLRGEVVTRALLDGAGRPLVFFRHPFTQTGPTPEIKAAFEEFLAGHGYRVAPFTVEDADYMFNALYEEADATGDEMRAARVREAYAAHQARMLDWFERLARDLFGRDIAQVLLIHVNSINADTLDERLAALEGRGYRFVPLDRALADAAYATPDRFVGPNGPSWLHRWSVAKGMPMRLRDEPDPPAWVMDAWRTRQRAAGNP